MTDGGYDFGCVLGKHWAQRDATQQEIEAVRSLGNGHEWVSQQATPAAAFAALFTSTPKRFFGAAMNPSSEFIAGFIDGSASKPHRGN